MKTLYKNSLVLIMLSLGCLYSCSSSNDLSSMYDFTVKYKLSGEVKGEMTTYKKGKRIQQNLVMDIQGAKMSTKNYFDEKYAYMVMDVMGKKMGTKIDIGKYREEGAKEGKDIDYANIENHLKDKKKVGTETILGKECDVYETGKDVKISVWKNTVPLKISTPSMTMTAVSYDTKADISESEMDPPKDVEYTDMSGMINKTKK